MCQRLRAVLLATAVVVVCLPAAAFAQVGNIAGTVRDSSGAVLPGVAVEATSPQLIGSPRSTVTDERGRYQILSLPVGVYKVTFVLDGFATIERTNVQLSSDFTAPVNAEMSVGALKEVIEVVGTIVPLVDVRNVQQRQVFSGEEIVDLPTTRNLGDLVQLVPGIAIGAQGGGLSEASICSGGDGQGAFSGALSGCSPIMTGFNAHSSMNDGDSINQGRMQVDGLGIQSFGGGGRSSYIADVGQAREVSITLSGGLGETETGGTTINVIPRTGGNRYAGNYFTAYAGNRFYDRNDKTRRSTFQNRLSYNYDINGAYGGPILRDRLWFYASARRQDRESIVLGNYRNLNEGIFGMNYRFDPKGQVLETDTYQNVSTRLTLQATRRDRLNLFWDEQYTCETPCRGAARGFGNYISIEATGSPLTRPLHVAQASWTNPLTNRILLEAATSHYSAHRNETRHLVAPAYPDIPRISESNALLVPDALNVPMVSGSINNAINWKIDNVQSRASASYVTGSHNVKVGFQGQFMARESKPHFNDLRLLYNYARPAANCTATKPTFDAVTNVAWCGLRPQFDASGRPIMGSNGKPIMVRNFDGLPESEPVGAALPSAERWPVPTSFTQYIPGGSDETGFFNAFYVQDQWTVKRLTLNGALRYDNAKSRFGETCVGPDLYTQYPYCLNEGGVQGVSYHNITPRVGAAWDVFGTGKTAVKWSMGQYLQGASLGGIYVSTNPASGGRTVNSLTRTWRDLNGDRIVNCDVAIPAVAPTTGFPANGECASVTGGAAINARRFGRSPSALDDAGIPISLNTMYCGQENLERHASPAIVNYCQNYYAAGGESMLSGWNKRQYEWQHSIGVQHQLLRRLSAEVTFNHRTKRNQTVTDAIGAGCDLYSGVAVGASSNYERCNEGLLNFQSDYYDFFGVKAPNDPRLPGGGGFVVMGIATPKCAAYSTNPGEEHVCVTGVSAPTSSVSAVTIVPEGALPDYWRGIDVNFAWRPFSTLRVNGGTSTGKRYVENCNFLLASGTPTGQLLMEGRERSCDRDRPWQTNVRGTASYTIPWVDVLVSSAFSVRPGVERQAIYTVSESQLVWHANSANRTGTTRAGNTDEAVIRRNLLSNDIFGERMVLIDLKVGKNFRFAGKRVNIGADIYNALNSDAARAYCNEFPNPEQGILGCNVDGGVADYGAVTNIVSPRYARFQLRFDF